MPARWSLMFPLLLLSLFVVDAIVAQENSYDKQTFPLPDALKPNVEFWKNVYSKYSEREVIIHDSDDLDIIYEVVHKDSLFRGIQVSERLQWKKIELIKKKYRSILLTLAKKKNLNWNELNDKERHVAALFGDRLNRTRLARAANDVRAQGGLKERFVEGIKRSGLYLPQIREIFADAGIPDELIALPHVESSFLYTAYSKFGAAGIWQFTRSTGRLFLRIDYDIDERFDPIRATEAAAKLLKRNFEELGSWPLAINAYNHGLYGMKRAARRYGTDIGKIVENYKSRSYGFASRNFYAEFLAALELSSHYKTYFGDIDLYEPANYVVFQTPRYISVKSLLDQLQLDPEDFRLFNPALRAPILNSKRRIPKNVKVRIPWKEDLNLKALYADISSGLKADEQIPEEEHRVRRGETLSRIANRYDVTVYDLVAYNDLDNAHTIYVGQTIRIPGQGEPTHRIPVSKRPAAKVQLADATSVNHTEDASMVDAPVLANRPVTLDIENANPDDVSAMDMETSAAVKTGTNVLYLPAKSSLGKSDMARSKTGLNAVNVKQAEKRYALLEEDMNLALPGFGVEMTRAMGTRMVKTANIENVNPPFRELDMPENGQVRVEPDETLGHFADWLEVSTYKLRKINGLRYGEAIRVEQPLWLTFENVTPEEFHRRRTLYHQVIEEDFYRNFDIEGVKTYTVNPGENIWIIANRNLAIPSWLIRKYNPDLDLNNLVAGQEIVVPIVQAKNLNESPIEQVFNE